MACVDPLRLSSLKVIETAWKLAPIRCQQALQPWPGKAANQVSSEGGTVLQQQAGVARRVTRGVQDGSMQAERLECLAIFECKIRRGGRKRIYPV